MEFCEIDPSSKMPDFGCIEKIEIKEEPKAPGVKRTLRAKPVENKTKCDSTKEIVLKDVIKLLKIYRTNRNKNSSIKDFEERNKVAAQTVGLEIETVKKY